MADPILEFPLKTGLKTYCDNFCHKIKMLTNFSCALNSCKLVSHEWNKMFFCIYIHYRGHHRKGVAIYDATEVNL